MNPRISYGTNQRLPIVAKVIKADLAFITGKFETLGSNFRHETGRAAAVPSYYIPGSLLEIFSTLKKLFKSPLESQRVNKSIFLKNYFAAS